MSDEPPAHAAAPAPATGGSCVVLSFRDEPPGGPHRAHRVTPDELRDAFADGWRIEAIGPVTIDSSLPAPAGRIRGWRPG